MANRPRIGKVTRMMGLEGQTLCYMWPALRRGRCPYDFIDVDRVPPFEGEEAWFEMVQVREPGCPWPRWKVLRRVEAPEG